jgi:hypothetical protein
MKEIAQGNSTDPIKMKAESKTKMVDSSDNYMNLT